MYYVDLCNYAEMMEHAQPFGHFEDLLDDEHLLPENYTEEDLDRVFEDPDVISDEHFFSLYYYSKIVLSQVPGILEQYGRFPDESKKFEDMMKRVPTL